MTKMGRVEMAKHLKVVVSGEIETRLSCEQKRLGMPMTGVVITILNDSLPTIEQYAEWGIFDPEKDTRIAPDNKSSKSAKPKTAKRPKPDDPRGTIPTTEKVFVYFCQRGIEADRAKEMAENFCHHYEGSGWRKANGDPIQWWKMTASTWVRRDKEWREEKKGDKGKGKSGRTYF